MDRLVDVYLSDEDRTVSMLMFGSNNYLGLANHPKVKERVARAIDKWGCGVAGPPLLNGYCSLIEELEARLAHQKGQEDTLIYSSGYAANVGMVSGLVQSADSVFYDAYSHSSFIDGLRLAGARGTRFPHNDATELANTIAGRRRRPGTDTYIAIEGVYSMDGDIADLPNIAKVARQNDAILIVDDAHGSGVIGDRGHGVGEYYGLSDQIDVLMGTFSKSFAVSGGFISSSKAIVEMLRWFSRAYMFSASPSPTVISAVLAGLDVLDNEPDRIRRLKRNVEFCSQELNALAHGFQTLPNTAILVLPVPQSVNIRRMNQHFEEAGIFLNPVEYPAVALEEQRFRISLSADHTKQDIRRLVEVTDEIWSHFVPA